MWVEREETIRDDIKNIHPYVEQIKKIYGSNCIQMTSSCWSCGSNVEVRIVYKFWVDTGAFGQRVSSRKITNRQGNVVRVLNDITITLCDIKKVIFNAPATIVFWEDGTKTVVKADEEDYDPEKGLAMAIAKKSYGNKGNYFNIFKKWLSNIKGE